jgi:hypothetical protein
MQVKELMGGQGLVVVVQKLELVGLELLFDGLDKFRFFFRRPQGTLLLFMLYYY